MQKYSDHTAATHPPSASSASVSSSANPSPSFARRRALREVDEGNQTRVIDSYPLSKYMVISQRLFGYFQKSFEQLNLDEAYVYGMRFAQLGLTELPKHREWATAVKETQENLRSQVAEVLSRLETIKRRMDEDETAKVRARMLARAEVETRRQNQFHREQEHRWVKNKQTAAEVEAMKEFDSSNGSKISGHSYLDERFQSVILSTGCDEPDLQGDVKLRIKAKRKKATEKLRKFLGFPKSSKEASKIAPSPGQDDSAVSQPALPSLSAIRQSRAQYELHTRKLLGSHPHSATRYTIEELPVVEEVTLRLHPTQTPSLLHLQYDPSLDETFLEEIEETQKQPYTQVCREHYNEEELQSTTDSPVVGVQETLVLSKPGFDSSQLSTNHINSISETWEDAILSPKDTGDTARNITRREIKSNEFFSTNTVTELARIDSNQAETSSLSASSHNADAKERILAGITRCLRSTHYPENSLFDRYELVLTQLKKKLASIYTYDHVIFKSTCEEKTESIDNDELIDPDFNPQEISNQQNILNAESVEDHNFTAKECGRDKTNINTFDEFDTFLVKRELIEEDDEHISTDECTKNTQNIDAFEQFDAFLAKREMVEEKDKHFSMKDCASSNNNTNTFDQFDAFLANRALIEGEEEDQSYIMALEEEISVEKEACELKSYLDYSVIEETICEEDVHLEYSVAEESVKTFQTKKAKDKNALNLLVNSPTCVATDKIVSSYDIPGFQPANERLQKFPSVNLRHSLDNDDMTYITMDTYLEDIDVHEKEPLEEGSKQRIKKILHKDLWKRDVDIVGGAMGELNEIAKNRASSRVVIAEYGGIMAIIRTMIGFQDDEGIQFLCCTTLGLLASESETRSMINDMDAVPLISRSMTGHPKSRRIQDAARDCIAAVCSE